MPVSINGTSGLVFNDASTQNTAPSGFGFKNRIINGNMTISQRLGTSSVTPTTLYSQYTLDRWTYNGSQASKASVQQDAGAVTPPSGFSDYLGITSLSAYSVTSSDFFGILQHIEGFNTADLAFGTASASPVTLSFWVRSSLTGTFGGNLANSANNRNYVFSYTINAANTWEQKTITVAGDTTGTWLTNNGIGLQVVFSIGSGSNFTAAAGSWSASATYAPTGQVSVVGTNGATFYITGVQLEKGSTATSFDYRPYGTELALCQRYYYMLVNGASQSIANGFFYASNSGSFSIQFPVTMRSSPSIEKTTGSNYYAIEGGGYTRNITGNFTLDSASSRAARIYENTSLSSATAGQGNWFYSSNSSSFVAFSAEL
jgi:hypothetical protein